MRRKDLFALAALILLIISPLLRAAEPNVTHQVELSKQANAYKVGDVVDVLDADGKTFTVKIEKVREKGVDVVTKANERYHFPVERIVRKVGAIAEGWAWLTDTTAGNTTLAIGGGILALGTGKLVSDAQVSSDKDTDQTSTAAAAIQAKQAAENALREGTVDGSRYYISGTFVGPSAYDGNGEWKPSLTIATNSDGRGGTVLSATVPNKADGSPQTLEGIGTWTVLRAGAIVIRNLPPPYPGDATLSGISPYGPVAFAGAAIRLASGATLTGGTAQAGNPPEAGQ